MIEFPVIINMLSDLQSGTMDVVLADACRTYGDQRAAEAREQMREECIKLFPQPHVEYHGDAIVIAIERLP